MSLAQDLNALDDPHRIRVELTHVNQELLTKLLKQALEGKPNATVEVLSIERLPAWRRPVYPFFLLREAHLNEIKDVIFFLHLAR